MEIFCFSQFIFNKHFIQFLKTFYDHRARFKTRHSNKNVFLLVLGVIVRGYKYFSPILKNDIGCGKFKRDPNQIWITTHSEAALNTVQMNHLKTAQVMRSAFNWSMSFSTRSTIYRPWFFVREKKQPSQTFLDVKNGIENMNKSKDFCWLVSNCHHDWAKRREFANKLIPLLPSKLHIWGSGYEDCLDRQSKNDAINHGKFPGHYNELYEPQQKRMKECKFYLAFDNAICSDFVTEKFSNSLEAGAIPIVNGWRDSYEQRVPGSFIHVADFRTVSDLANHLQYLLSDENAFMEYHKWRLNYEIERLHLQAVCDVCRKIKDFKKNPKPSLIPDLSTMHDSLQECQKT